MLFRSVKIFSAYLFASFFLAAYAGGGAVPAEERLELSPQIGTNKSIAPFGVFQSMDFSPDGKTIAVGSDSGFIQLWSSQGYLLRAWRIGTQGGGVKFSNSGKLLASYIVPFAEVYLWRPVDGSLVKQFEIRSMLSQEEIKSVEFSPDDSLLLLAGDHYLVVWDLAKNSARLTINSSRGDNTVLGAYFAASGSLLVTNTKEDIKIWDIQGRLIRTIPVKGLTGFIVAGKEIICRAGDIVTIWNFKGVLQGKIDVGQEQRISPRYMAPLVFLKHENAILTASIKGFHAWTRKGRLLWEISRRPRGESDNLGELRASPDGRSFAASTHDGEISIWDSASGAKKALVLKEITGIRDFALFPRGGIVTSSMKLLEETGKLNRGLGFSAVHMTVSPDGKMIAVSTDKHQVILFSDSWNTLHTFPGGMKTANERLLPVSFSPDSRRLAVPTESGIVVYDCATGKVSAEIALDPVSNKFSDNKSCVTELHFMPDGKTLLLGYYLGPMMLIDIASNARVIPQNMPAMGLHFVDPNANLIIREDGSFGTAYYDNIRFWSPTGRELPSIPISTPDLCHNYAKLAYSAHNKLMVVGGWSGAIEVIDSATRKLVKELPLRFSPVTRIRFSPDGTHLMASSEDGMLKMWNTQGWDSATILTTDDNEWLIYTPDGYFDASPHGGELVAMVKGGNAYGIEQFAARNNRPDLILERLRLGTPEQIAHYQDLYRRRLEKLGLTEAQLHAKPLVPEARVIKVEKQGKFADVTFEISGAGHVLERINVFVNNVPLFGPGGKKIKGETLLGTERIELESGKNKIEISALSSAGVESYRAVAYAEYDGRERGNLYYLGIGVSKYKDASLDLSYADKDVEDLKKNIQKMNRAYGKIFVRNLLNADVTPENIKKAKDFLKSSKVDDTVVVLMAGHGGYSKGASPKYYYFPYGADPADLAKTGVAFDEIEGLIAGLGARKKLLLMDTCESGELEEADFTRYMAQANSRGINPRTFRKVAKRRGVGTNAPRSYLLQKDRFIYNDLARRTGAVVFSSSRGNEISYESQAIQNGFFTKRIIDALFSKTADRDLNGKISVDELKVFVRDLVSRDTGGLQNPTVDRDNLAQKIEFPSLAR